MANNSAPIYTVEDRDGNQFFPLTHERAVKDSNGVSLETKLAGLESKTYVEAWGGASTPVVANIPAGVTVTYNSTTYTGTLEASSSTIGKIYLVKNGSNYDRYITSQSGSSYSWVANGTTAMDLSGYATDEDLERLDIKVKQDVLQQSSPIGTPIFQNYAVNETGAVYSQNGVNAFYADIRKYKSITIHAFAAATNQCIVLLDSKGAVITTLPTNSAADHTITFNVSDYDDAHTILGCNRTDVVPQADFYLYGILAESIEKKNIYDPATPNTWDIHFGAGEDIDPGISPFKDRARTDLIPVTDFSIIKISHQARVICFDGSMNSLGVVMEAWLSAGTNCTPIIGTRYIKVLFVVDHSTSIETYKNGITISEGYELNFTNGVVRFRQAGVIFDKYEIPTSDGNRSRKIKSVGFIPIIPGHSYDFKLGVGTGLSGVGIDQYDKDLNSLGFSWLQKRDITYTPFKAHKNARYIRLTTLTPEGVSNTATETLWSGLGLIDVTKTAYLHNLKKLPLTIGGVGSVQDLTIADDTLFLGRDGLLSLYDLHTKSLIQNITLPQDNSENIHCNNIEVGPKYDNSDPFGVLWISANNGNAHIKAYRIVEQNGTYSLSEIYSFAPPQSTVSEKTSQYFDFKNNKLAQIAYKSSQSVTYGDMVVEIYSVSAWTNSATFTKEKSFDLDKMWALQGGTFHNGMLTLAVGTSSNNAGEIMFVDVDKEDIVDMFDLKLDFGMGQDVEIQGVDKYNGAFLLSSSDGVFEIE